MLDLSRRDTWTEPYPLFLAKDVLPSDTYRAMVDVFPDESIMAHMVGSYEKFSLSERNNPNAYAQHIGSFQVWRDFREYIKGAGFLEDVAAALDGLWVPGKLGQYKARFEFSSLPVPGGKLDPHTDIASKVVTLVIPMDDGTGDPMWGTDILKPKYKNGIYEDYKTPLSAFNRVRTVGFAPNQCLLFIKGKHSWHSVGPLQGEPGTYRRSLTINIEVK